MPYASASPDRTAVISSASLEAAVTASGSVISAPDRNSLASANRSCLVPRHSGAASPSLLGPAVGGAAHPAQGGGPPDRGDRRRAGGGLPGELEADLGLIPAARPRAGSPPDTGRRGLFRRAGPAGGPRPAARRMPGRWPATGAQTDPP